MKTPERYEKRKKELIGYCRYYKGEPENPYEGTEDNTGLLWHYERHWVDVLAESYENAKPYRADYEYLKLGDFYIEVDVPRSLIGLLVNRYLHWGGGYGAPEEENSAFKRWFRREYLKSASD